MMFTTKEEEQIRDMLALHLQRMKTHKISFAMDGTRPSAEMLAAHNIEANKCRTIIDQIIAKEQ